MSFYYKLSFSKQFCESIICRTCCSYCIVNSSERNTSTIFFYHESVSYFLFQSKLKESFQHNRLTIYDLLISHGDIEDYIFFAVLMQVCSPIGPSLCKLRGPCLSLMISARHSERRFVECIHDESARESKCVKYIKSKDFKLHLGC